jgi:hypothetical protein
MTSKHGSSRGSRSSRLGLEGLESRTVLSGMPIDLAGLAQSVLTRLSCDPAVVDAGDQVADVEATGFSVVLPSVVPNGLPVRALIMAVGADGLPVAFNGEISLSSTDEAASLPETATLSRGRGFVSVTFATAGEQTLSVTTGGENPLTGSDTTQVAEPIVATQLVLRLPKEVRADAPVAAMLMAVDASGRRVPNFSGEVSITSSDEAATLPETVTFVMGRAMAPVTFRTEGEQTLTVKAGDLTAEATTMVAAQPAVADFRIQLQPEVVAGRPTLVTVVAVDADGAPVRGFSGSATLTASDEGARLPDAVQFRRGRAYFQVAFASLGEQQITAATGDLKATATTMVKEAPAVSSLTLWMPRQAVVGLPMLIQVAALDADGRLARGFSGILDVKSSDSDATLPSTVEFINGIALLQATFATVGDQTLSVSDPAKPELTASGTTTVIPLRLPELPPWFRR